MRTLKTNLGIVTIALAILMGTSCKNTKNENTEQKEVQTEINKEPLNKQQTEEIAMRVEFKNPETARIFQHYIHLKTALVNSDAQEAKSGAAMLGDAFEDGHEAKETVKAIAAAEDLEKQRELFSTLTTQMEGVLKGALASGEIYKQFCPMAFNNTGGYWFSDSKEIRNPYFGDKMLKCGSVRETIQ